MSTTEVTTTAAPATPHMDQLRDHLMQTLAALRDKVNPMEPDRARAVAQVAGVLVDTAKVEVDYLKATGQDRSKFLELPAGAEGGPPGHTPASPFPTPTGAVTRLPGVTQHRMRG